MSRSRRRRPSRLAASWPRSPVPRSWTRRRQDDGRSLRRTWLAAALGLLTLPSVVHAETARFWFSLSPDEPYQFAPGPPASDLTAAPRVELVEGAETTLYLWFRPRTLAAGPHDPASNPYDRLISFSLDVANRGPAALVGGGRVLNPGERRFDRVIDSAPENRFPVTLLNLDEESDDLYVNVFYPLATPEKLVGLMGFTLNVPGPRAGIGTFADGSDSGSVTTATGPAWLVGSIDLAASSVGVSELFLQVGSAGMMHWDDRRALDDQLACVNDPKTLDPTACVADTFVAFGPGTAQGDVVYDHGRQRQITLTGDGADAAIEVRRREQGDFDANGAVDGRDLLDWQRALGPAPAQSLLDVNGDGQIDERDAANWERDFGLRAFERAPPPVAAASVPEPSAAALGWLAWCAAGRRRRGSLKRRSIVLRPANAGARGSKSAVADGK